MDWTAEKLDWTIDGKVVRTLTPAMVKGDFYPQTPMAARIGIWAGGDSGNDQGVIGTLPFLQFLAILHPANGL